MPKKENMPRKNKNKPNALKMMIYKLYTIKMMICQKPAQTKECAGFHVQAGVRL